MAIDRVQATIEFNVKGEIITANEDFLSALGYQLYEIQGKHHSIFCEPSYVQSPDYKAFWDRLNKGQYIAEEFKRIGKNGKPVWISGELQSDFRPQW